MNNTTTLAAVFGAVLLSSTGASAATFSFENGGSLFDQPALSLSSDGISVVVTAGTYRAPGNPGTALADRSFTPLGVDLGPDGLYIERTRGEEAAIDGKGSNELVLFDFGTQRVALTSIVFDLDLGNSQFTDDSLFDFFVDGIFRGRANYATADTIFADQRGSVFGIGASLTTTGFRLAEISTTPVPLPASGLMLVGALAGFGAMRRRTQA